MGYSTDYHFRWNTLFYFIFLYCALFQIGIGESEDIVVKNIDVGKRFHLQCNITTEPARTDSLTVNWSKGDTIDTALPIEESNKHVNIYASNNTLEIPKPTDDDAGFYICTIQNTTGNATFQVNTKPRVTFKDVLLSTKSINKVQGEDLILHCIVEGKPTPEVDWLRDDKNISVAMDDRITVDGANLTIADLKEEDRAEYTCFATNPAGSANITVLVRVKDKLAALWPFLGIVAEVGVLCTIIFIYEKRRAKQEIEESDTDQSPDTKNVSDNKEKDVRQRK